MIFGRGRGSSKVAEPVPQPAPPTPESERVVRIKDAFDTAQREVITRQDRIARMKTDLDQREFTNSDDYAHLYGAIQFEERQLATAQRNLEVRERELSFELDRARRAAELERKSRELASVQSQYETAFTEFKTAEVEFLRLKNLLPERGGRVQSLMKQLGEIKSDMERLQRPAAS